MPAHEAPDHDRTISPAPSLQADALLAGLEDWRDILAGHFVKKHPSLTEADLNRAVLLAIVRILFFKIGEERGLVEHGTLQRLSGADHIHERLSGQDDRAGIGPLAVVFSDDETARRLPPVDDQTLRIILKGTASFEFPSPVSMIPPEDLAAVFERYLKTTIRIAEGYRIKRDDTSAVKYAGGVHITPQPVVKYMIRETIGRLVEGKTPREVSRIRVLDPACGAGIVLIAAYRYLLDWHLAWYRNNLVSVLAGKERISPDGVQTLAEALPAQDGQKEMGEPELPVRYSGTRDPEAPSSWTLAPSEKQRILAASIAGTDIDPEACEVARFLLLLATLDEFTPLTVDQMSIPGLCMTAERLRDTIRCGNTLIGPDYFTHKQEHPFNADERRRVNAFDWQAAYPGICAGGGFDAVIGAPPAHRPFSMASRDDYFQMHYAVYAKTAGLYAYFIERGLQLLKDGGVLSLTVPGTFLRSHHARPLRRLLLDYQIEEIAGFGECRVLQGSQTRMCILMIAKSRPDHAFRVSRAERSGSVFADDYTMTLRFRIDQRSFGDGGWTLEDRRVEDLIEKLRTTGTSLDGYVMGQIEGGTHTIKNNPLVIDAAARTRFIRKDWRCKRLFTPLLLRSDIQRYLSGKPDRFLITAKNTREIKRCRLVWKYIQSAMSPSLEPAEGKPEQYTMGDATANKQASISREYLRQIPKTPKIIYAQLQESPAFSYDHTGSYAITRSLYAIPRRDPVLVAILNSTLGRFFIEQTCVKTGRGYHLTPEKLGKFPVCTPDFDNPADTARHDRMDALVTQMLELYRQLPLATTDQERRLVQQEIEATDIRIDALVYELYGLTAEDIAIIHEKTGK